MKQNSINDWNLLKLFKKHISLYPESYIKPINK